MAEQENNCRCYTVQGLELEDSFNFDPAIGGLALPPPKRVKPTPCLQYLEKAFGPSSFDTILPKMKLAAAKILVNMSSHKDAVRGILKAWIRSSSKMARLIDRFDWSRVEVFKDGRLYLVNPTKVMWQHRLFEWKSSRLFRPSKLLQQKEDEAVPEEKEVRYTLCFQILLLLTLLSTY